MSFRDTVEKGLEAISGEYHGRIILIGRAETGQNMVGYAVTGRSPSSRARILHKKRNGVISTFPTNLKVQINPEEELSSEAKEEIIKSGGNPSLLIYDAIVSAGKRKELVAVSNGAQTNLIADAFDGYNALGELARMAYSFREPNIVNNVDLTSFEPDFPNYTPRISGILAKDRGILSIIRHEGLDLKSKSFFDFPLAAGKGRVIATYPGKNVEKGHILPSYHGEPGYVALTGKSPKEVAEKIYEALGPKSGEGILSPGDDFRVGVAVAFYDSSDNSVISDYIINRGGN